MLEKIKTNIKSILFSRQFKMFLLLGLFSFVIFSFGIDTTFATETNKDAGVKSDQANLANDLLGLLQYLAGMAGGLIGGLTALLSILLNPSWVNGTLFDMSEYIRQAWVFVSNVVYLIFAGLLIAISFANIVGKGTGDFELKTALPKFVVGLLIVPFSWFIVQLVISIASILAVSVYAWPIEAFSDKLSSTNESIEWCSNRTMNLQGKLNKDNTSGSNTTINTDKEGFFYCSDSTVGKKTIKEILNPEKGNIGSIIALYSFGVMDVGSLDKFSKDHVKDITDIFSLSAKVLFDIVFIFVYLVLLAALFIAMFARVIVLWIFMIISPLFGLLYFLGKGKVKEFDKIGFKDFLSLAMVPVYVSAALSFGLMFLLIIGEGGKDNGYQPQGWEVAALASGDRTYNLGITTLVIKGVQASSNDKEGFLFKIAGGALGTLGYLMLKIFGLAFLWMAVIAALKQSSITSKLVEPFERFGSEVGKFAMESPKFIPIPGTSKMNDGKMMTAGGLLGGIKQGVEMKMRGPNDEARNFSQRFFGDEETKKLGKAIQEAHGKGLEGLRDVFQNHDEAKLYYEREKIADELKINGVEGAERLKTAKDQNDFIKILTEINNDNKNMSLDGGKGVLGRKMRDTDDTKDFLGGKKSSGSSTDGGDNTSGKFNFEVNNNNPTASISDKAVQYLSQMIDGKAKLTIEEVKTDLKARGEVISKIDEIATEMNNLSIKTGSGFEGLIVTEKVVKETKKGTENEPPTEPDVSKIIDGSTVLIQGNNPGKNVASNLDQTGTQPVGIDPQLGVPTNSKQQEIIGEGKDKGPIMGA